MLLRCRLLGGARRFSAHMGGEGRGPIVAAARLQLVCLGRNAYDGNECRRMVVARSNCSQIGVERRSNRSRIVVVTTALVAVCVRRLVPFLYLYMLVLFEYLHVRECNSKKIKLWPLNSHTEVDLGPN